MPTDGLLAPALLPGTVRMVQVAPLSVETGLASNGASIVRPSCESVHRIGSRPVAAVQFGGAALLSSQSALAGATLSLKVTRSVLVFDWNTTFPVFQLAPIDGSPASVP